MRFKPRRQTPIPSKSRAYALEARPIPDHS